jgi:AcrR family transcriptional regulator
MPETKPRTRKSAEERREEIVAIGIQQFALAGYNGTSTEAIAREAGISQPYLFRLFRTKRELFLACAERCYATVAAVFADAVTGDTPKERMQSMGRAYVERLLPDRHALLFQLQGYAAAGDPAIQEAMRRGFSGLVRTVIDLAGVPESEAWPFFADGMLLNVVAALNLTDEPWAQEHLAHE